MKIGLFVTGGSGFIGGNFLELLSQYIQRANSPIELSVTALVRSENHPKLAGIQYIKGSLQNIQEFRDELLNSDYVFHLAAKATYGLNDNYDEDNVIPIEKMIEILKQSRKLKNFVFLSTIGAVDRARFDFCFAPISNLSSTSPRSQYGKSKLTAESLLAKGQIPFTIIRPTWVYGKGMRPGSHIYQFVTLAAKHFWLPFYFKFPGKVSLINVTDLCRALFNSLENKKIIGKTYIGETEAKSIGNILSIIWNSVWGKEPFQLHFFNMFFWVRFCHSFLPLQVSNLFCDYLWAKDEAFKSDFRLEQTTDFTIGIKDIIEDHAYISGVTIVTGANSGIGLSLVKTLVANGKSVVGIDRDTSKLKSISGTSILEMDLAQNLNLELIQEKVGSFRIVALVNNAGVGRKGDTHSISNHDISYMTNVNFLAPIFLTKLLLPQLAKSNGCVINVGSSVAYNPLPGMSIYAATKAALVSWSEALSQELKAKVRVATISPSGTKTQFQTNAGVSGGADDLLEPNIVAEKIFMEIYGRGGHFLIGAKSIPLIIVTRFMPLRLSAKIWGKLFAKLR